MTYQEYVKHALEIINSLASQHDSNPLQLTDEQAWYVFQGYCQTVPASFLNAYEASRKHFQCDFPMLWSVYRVGLSHALGQF